MKTRFLLEGSLLIVLTICLQARGLAKRTKTRLIVADVSPTLDDGCSDDHSELRPTVDHAHCDRCSQVCLNKTKFSRADAETLLQQELKNYPGDCDSIGPDAGKHENPKLSAYASVPGEAM